MANQNSLNNLMPIEEVNSRRTREQHSEDSRKGGKNSGESRTMNAEMRKKLEKILKMTLKEGKADKIHNISEAKGANLTVSEALIVKLVTMALSGNMKALSELLRLVGMENIEQPQATQEQTTGFVNALNDTAVEVWADEAPEKE